MRRLSSHCTGYFMLVARQVHQRHSGRVYRNRLHRPAIAGRQGRSKRPAKRRNPAETEPNLDERCERRRPKGFGNYPQEAIGVGHRLRAAGLPLPFVGDAAAGIHRRRGRCRQAERHAEGHTERNADGRRSRKGRLQLLLQRPLLPGLQRHHDAGAALD